MKQILIGLLVLFVLPLTACQKEIPPQTTTPEVGDEFTLSPDQSLRIDEAGLTITLVDVSDDQRCPLEIECAVSGPVTLVITLQKDSFEPHEFTLQTFTDANGRAPEKSFEGIPNLVKFGAYIIQVMGVLPYPTNLTDKIGRNEYQVWFVVEPRPVE